VSCGQFGFVTKARQPPNTPLQQTKPHCILWAFVHRVRGFAAERQVVRWPHVLAPGDSVRRYLIPCAAMSMSLLPSCRNPRHTSMFPIAPCGTPMVPRGDWQLIDRGDFSFELPPSFRRRAGTGIDSWVESYSSRDGRETVSFDYGQWSNPLLPDSETDFDFATCQDSIGGKPATVVIHRIHDPKHQDSDGWYIAVAAWRSPVTSRAHLTLSTATREPSSLNVLLTVLRTVKFREPQGR
jgi:hypothetical protein